MSRGRGGRLFGAEPKREVEDELEFHIEERTREYMAAGMDAESARRAALERIGDLEQVRGECTHHLVAERRSLARRDWLSDLRQDLRFAVRSAGRAPLFSLMAVITLALGIGANSAVFGVLKSVLLDALPYADPDRLVRVQARYASAPDLGGPLSAGSADDIGRRQRSFSHVAISASGGPDAVLLHDAGATTVRAAWVRPDYFATFGVSPVAGRVFTDAEATMDTAQVVVLTWAAWQQYFGGSDALGRTIRLNGIARTVIGVLPREFIHPVRHADLFLPLNLAPTLNDPVTARGSHFLEVFARLRPGVTLAAAQADMRVLGAALAREHPRENNGLSFDTQRLHDTMVSETRTPLLVLMASAALVLLIACANLAAALLSRTIARRREFAVRISLGAGRGRLIRQLLAESVLLAVAGGVAGLALAAAALASLRGASLAALPAYADLSLDGVAIVVTFVVALLTGAAFGLMPALTVGQTEPQTVLRDESRGAGDARGAGRLRGLLVAGQVALCLSLLAGAGLLTRSLWLMASAPLGFTTDHTLAFTVPLSNSRYPNVESVTAFHDEMRQRIGGLPGVRDVAVTTFVPTRVYNSNGVSIIGQTPSHTEATPFILTNGVSENYFNILGIPLIAGRTFSTADHADSAPVAVVSETMAQRFWPAGNAVGARIRMGPDPESTPVEVIGVVGDVRTSLTDTRAEPMLYRSLRQGWFGFTFLVRTATDPVDFTSTIRRELGAVDPTLPMADIITLDAVIDEGLASRRLPMMLMLSFGGLALLLACVGIYALFANMAIAREREFGVRIALGSSRGAVAALVLRQGALWMAAGLVGGAFGVIAVSRALRSLIYGVAPLDLVSLAAALGALLLSAGVALALPVYRATRADPVSTMR
jgi:putative ABC transport system permease protein